MPMTGVRGISATQYPFQGGKTVSPSSGQAVAAMSASAESSNAPQAAMTDIGPTTTVRKPTRAQLVLELAEARRAVLEAEQDCDFSSDSETSHSDDVGGGAAFFGQPPPSRAQEIPSTVDHSSPLTPYVLYDVSYLSL
jgi:hypothetical protein